MTISLSALRPVWRALLVCCLFSLPAAAMSAASVPGPLASRVTDYTGKLSADTLEFLSGSIEEGEKDHGPLIRAVVIESSAPDSLDDFADKLLAAQPPKAMPDALLVLQPSAQTARIAVKEALRERLTPVMARVILRESVFDYLRDGNVSSAIEQGTRKIEKVLRGEVLADAPVRQGTVPAGAAKSAADGLVAIPAYANVIDLTNTLAPQDLETLRSDIARIQTRKGAQVAIFMLPSSKPESIEALALRVFEAWKLGRKGVDDGVLVLVAKNDRRMRIEVGYGLEGVLTDAISFRIINEQLSPAFKRGDFGGGLTSGLEQIGHVIEGETLPPLKAAGDSYDGIPDTTSLGAAAAIVILGIVAGFWIPSSVAALLAALGTGAVLWFLKMGPDSSIFLAAMAGVLTYILPSAILGIGRSSGSGSSGGDGGSGHWSGGGGSSGGGGASGSW